MRIKINKLIVGDVVDISIRGLICSENNLMKIIDLFKYKYVIIEVGDVEKCSSLFQIIKSLSLKHTMSFYDGSQHTDIIFMIDSCNIREIIHHILISKCESFLLENITNYSQWEQYLDNRIYNRQLIKHNFITISMVVIINESQVDVSFHKDTYNAKQIAIKIKEIL